MCPHCATVSVVEVSALHEVLGRREVTSDPIDVLADELDKRRRMAEANERLMAEADDDA
jgi:hypothetical protein